MNDASQVRPRNVTVDAVRYGGSDALEVRLTGPYRGPDKDTFAFIPGLDFHDGTIEVDVAGSLLPGALSGARGFIGITFRIDPNATATAPNAVALGSGSVANVANTVSVGAPGGERRITNVAPGISQTDAVNVGQIQSLAAGFQSQVVGLQSQIIDNNREARTGTAVALALGGTANLQPGRRVALSAGYGNFQGSNAFGAGVTGLLLDTANYAVVGNAGVGFGVETNVVGTRGAVSLQW